MKLGSREAMFLDHRAPVTATEHNGRQAADVIFLSLPVFHCERVVLACLSNEADKKPHPPYICFHEQETTANI